MLLGVADLPVPLQEEIAIWLTTWPELADKTKARGRCNGVCYHLKLGLESRGLAAERAAWAFNEHDKPLPVHGFYRPEVSPFAGHQAVRVGNLYIDLTARQFGADVPHPLIWREEP